MPSSFAALPAACEASSRGTCGSRSWTVGEPGLRDKSEGSIQRTPSASLHSYLPSAVAGNHGVCRKMKLRVLGRVVVAPESLRRRVNVRYGLYDANEPVTSR